MPYKSARWCFKHFARSRVLWVLVAGLLSNAAEAKVIIEPIAPYVFDGTKLHWLERGTADVDEGFRTIDPQAGVTGTSGRDTSSLVAFDVRSDTNLKDTDLVVSIFVGEHDEDTISERLAIPIARVDGVACNSNICNVERGVSGLFHAARYDNGETLQIEIYLKDLCYELSRLGKSSEAGICSGANVGDPSAGGGSIEVSLRVAIGKPQANGTEDQGLTDRGAEYKEITIALSNRAPTFDSPGSPVCEQAWFPGDQQILLDTDIFGATTNDGVPIQKLVVIGKRPDATPSLTDRDFISRVKYRAGRQDVGGFRNTEDASDTNNTYGLLFGVRDASGALSTFDCFISGVRSAEIQGALNDSNCFIATAAFGSAEEGPVRLLRLFRDKILFKSEAGREFVRTYYRHSPPAAKWLRQNTWARSSVLLALLPVQAVAWLSLNPKFALLLMGMGLALLLTAGFSPRSRRTT